MINIPIFNKIATDVNCQLLQQKNVLKVGRMCGVNE